MRGRQNQIGRSGLLDDPFVRRHGGGWIEAQKAGPFGIGNLER